MLMKFLKIVGYMEGAGVFFVDELIYYESGVERPLKALDKSPSIVFLSGIDLVSL
jgi:hypothetical protein